MEVRKRLLDKKSKFQQLNDIQAEEYLEKARVLFHRDLQNTAFGHSEERSDEESITTKLMELQYLSGLTFFALPPRRDHSE